MMKIKYALIAAVLLVAATVTSMEAFKESTPLLDANVDALAEQKCPGEAENCDAGGERCCYYYDGKNYNIEGKHSKTGK